MLLCYQFRTLTCIHGVFQCLHLTKWRVPAKERRELFYLRYGQKNAKSALIYGHIFLKPFHASTLLSLFLSVTQCLYQFLSTRGFTQCLKAPTTTDSGSLLDRIYISHPETSPMSVMYLP